MLCKAGILKSFYKTISRSVADFLYSKSTQRDISHSSGTWALGHSKGTRTLKALGHFDTRALETLRPSKSTWALGQSGTRKTLAYSGTHALGHLDTRGTQGTLFSRLATWRLENPSEKQQIFIKNKVLQVPHGIKSIL